MIYNFGVRALVNKNEHAVDLGVLTEVMIVSGWFITRTSGEHGFGNCAGNIDSRLISEEGIIKNKIALPLRIVKK